MTMITRIDWSDDADERKDEDDVGALALMTSIPAFLSIANQIVAQMTKIWFSPPLLGRLVDCKCLRQQ